MDILQFLVALRAEKGRGCRAAKAVQEGGIQSMRSYIWPPLIRPWGIPQYYPGPFWDPNTWHPKFRHIEKQNFFVQFLNGLVTKIVEPFEYHIQIPFNFGTIQYSDTLLQCENWTRSVSSKHVYFYSMLCIIALPG